MNVIARIQFLWGYLKIFLFKSSLNQYILSVYKRLNSCLLHCDTRICIFDVSLGLHCFQYLYHGHAFNYPYITTALKFCLEPHCLLKHHSLVILEIAWKQFFFLSVIVTGLVYQTTSLTTGILHDMIFWMLLYCIFSVHTCLGTKIVSSKHLLGYWTHLIDWISDDSSTLFWGMVTGIWVTIINIVSQFGLDITQ
jgi:hypothetical protein